MAARYWTKVQRARKKHASTREKRVRSKKTKPKAKPRTKASKVSKVSKTNKRSTAAARGWETRRKNARAEERAKRARAKKSAETRAKRARALARQEKKAKRATAEVQAAKAEAREAKKRAKTERQKEKAETEAVRKLLEPKKYLEEQLEHAILKKYAPERKKLTLEEAEELKRKARPKIKKLFKRVIKEAEQTGEIQKLHKPYNVIIPRDGFKTTGSMIHVKLRVEMDEKAVEEVLYRVGQAAKLLHEKDPRKIWYAVLAISSLGRKLYVGGAIKFKESKHAIERLIMLESHPSTGIQDSIPNMLAALRVKLEELVDEGTITLLRHVTVRTWDFKTKEERIAWRERHGEKHAPEPTPPKKFKRRKAKRK